MTMPTPATPTTTIVLTPEEERVRRLLVDAAAEIDSGRAEHDEPLTLRFTGGWVRDKLIGQQSHDIDVGINKMTGFDFATRLQEFLTKHSDAYDIPTRNIHKVESNPEKSKHLETATTKILSLDIDFVNLRSESYTNDSRIPQMVRLQVVSIRPNALLTNAAGVRDSRPRRPTPRCLRQCPVLQHPHSESRGLYGEGLG